MLIQVGIKALDGKPVDAREEVFDAALLRQRLDLPVPGTPAESDLTDSILARLVFVLVWLVLMLLGLRLIGLVLVLIGLVLLLFGIG